MIFKCVNLVQILSSVVLKWLCLSRSAIRAFVHFLVHFLLLLAIETSYVNDNMIFKCVNLVQILLLVVLMWVCFPRPAIRAFVHFLVHFLSSHSIVILLHRFVALYNKEEILIVKTHS